MAEEHTSFIQTPRQLLIVVVLAFAIPITLIGLVSQLVTGLRPRGATEADSGVVNRIKPVGEILLASATQPANAAPIAMSPTPAAPPPTAATQSTPPKAVAPISTAAATTANVVAAASPGVKADGKKVFEGVCIACHGPGIAGAPKFGDKAAWAPRIAEGASVLYQHAINGYQGKSGVMPPKGGNTALPDGDVKAAVDYMTAAAK